MTKFSILISIVFFVLPCILHVDAKISMVQSNDEALKLMDTSELLSYSTLGKIDVPRTKDPPRLLLGSWYVYATMDYYRRSNTNSAAYGTYNEYAYIAEGEELQFNGCGCNGDQYIRVKERIGTSSTTISGTDLLYDDSDGYCGLCSTGGVICNNGEYNHPTRGRMCPIVIMMGCYSSNSCSGSVQVELQRGARSFMPNYETVPSPSRAPTRPPTRSPTRVPTRPPTRSPTRVPTPLPTQQHTAQEWFQHTVIDYSGSGTRYANPNQGGTTSHYGYLAEGDEIKFDGCGCQGDQYMRTQMWTGTLYSDSHSVFDDSDCGVCSVGHLTCTTPTWTHPTLGRMCPFLLHLGCYSDGSCSGHVKIQLRENSVSYMSQNFEITGAPTLYPTEYPTEAPSMNPPPSWKEPLVDNETPIDDNKSENPTLHPTIHIEEEAELKEDDDYTLDNSSSSEAEGTSYFTGFVIVLVMLIFISMGVMYLWGRSNALQSNNDTASRPSNSVGSVESTSSHSIRVGNTPSAPPAPVSCSSPSSYAAAPGVLERSNSLDRLYSCPICFEIMVGANNHPITIGECGHTFCKECLTQHFTARDRCPHCRVQIPANNRRNLRTNILLRDTIERIFPDSVV